MTEQTLTAAENEAVSDLVREALARRRITRRYLADQAKISLSTLEKALSGQRPFTLASIVRLEAALGVTLRKSTPAKSAAAARFAGIAPEELGSYGRAAISWIDIGRRSAGAKSVRISSSRRASGSTRPSPRKATSRSRTSPATSTSSPARPASTAW
jgi:transcriptional regulator with XRE-family HTH domain